MTLEQIQEQANALFQELNQLKVKEEIKEGFDESFRKTCINKINAFFQNVSNFHNEVRLHIVDESKDKKYKKCILEFEKAESPIDIELVCLHEKIHIPNWFRQINETFLGLKFIHSKKESTYYSGNWMVEEVQDLKTLMKNYKNENDNIYQVLERFIFSTQKMNLFGDDMKNQFAEIELKGLLMTLLEDFEIHGWEIASNIGSDNQNDQRILNIYFDKEVYVNPINTLKKLQEKHNLARVYEIIRKSIHKANQEYLGAIIKKEVPKVHWNFNE